MRYNILHLYVNLPFFPDGLVVILLYLLYIPVMGSKYFKSVFFSDFDKLVTIRPVHGLRQAEVLTSMLL